MDAERILIETPPTPDGVRALAAALADALRELGTDEAMGVDLELAVVEAANNIVEHGRTERPMRLALAIEPGWLRVAIDDEGEAFDPLSGPLPAVADDAVAGRGRAIIAALVDDAAYERRDGRNRLTLARRLG